MATPQGETFVEAADEAARTAVMSVRLVLALADAARRNQRRQGEGGAEELPSANEAGMALEGTAEWERTLRETLPAGPVREALLSSPDWPGISATMTESERHGVDVRRILATAHEGLGVGEPATASRDALLSYGPLTTGLDIPRDLDLSDRARALRQLSISRQENARYVLMFKDVLPGREREADLAVAARQWPLVAARMAKLESEGQPVAEHLAGLAKDGLWGQGPSARIGSRLVQAANHHLCHAPGEAPPTVRPAVSTAAARSQSSTMGPAKAPTAKGAAAAEPGVAAHRQRSGPSVRQGRTR